MVALNIYRTLASCALIVLYFYTVLNVAQWVRMGAHQIETVMLQHAIAYLIAIGVLEPTVSANLKHREVALFLGIFEGCIRK